ncbi:rod shape-determining protein MreC [Gilvibacter sp.]|uniref:rod shape-determining protein MreC n=1 Tax=Gilvibacter sp. TaxID=2729997 RepID=UPI0025BC4AB0|nr:rod shape-determining protein MreC [Gilvibacter sp.]NQX77208.1 rod shape-determining protein MreC [Gilvibacter sp.]
MQQLINFFIRKRHFLLFCVLVLLGLFFTFQSRSYHSGKYLSAANGISGTLFSWTSGISDYLNLKTQNELLQIENSQLREAVGNVNSIFQSQASQSTLWGGVDYIPARVINNNYSRTKNYLTIKGGEKLGIQTSMGVVSPNGILGITDKTSSGYATVLSILNTQSSINAKLTKSNHFGTLQWDTRDPNIVQLVDVQRLAPLAIGDSIVTGGRSTIFPAGIPIGAIESYELDQSGNYYVVQIKLFNDMTNLGPAYVIKMPDAAEIQELEETIPDEE